MYIVRMCVCALLDRNYSGSQLGRKQVPPPFLPCTSSPCSVVNFPEVPDNSPAEKHDAAAQQCVLNQFNQKRKLPTDAERRHLCLLQCLDNFDRQFTCEPPVLTPDDE